MLTDLDNDIKILLKDDIITPLYIVGLYSVLLVLVITLVTIRLI